MADASGRNTILGTQLKLKKKDPLFNQFAVHGWYEGVKRGEADNADFIHVYLLPHAARLGLADPDHRDDHIHRRRHRRGTAS